MKIPTWLASAVVAGTFALCGIAFEHSASQTQKLRDDVEQLKIEVAVIKARVAPEMASVTGPKSKVQVLP